MSETLKRAQQLVARGEVRISDHGYEELAADDIVARDVVAGISTALVVEERLADLQFLSCNTMQPACPCIFCGGSPQARQGRQSS